MTGIDDKSMPCVMNRTALRTISTKFIGPTNARGARIKATASGGRSPSGAPAQTLTIPYPHDLGMTEAHAKAAMMLAAKLDWRVRWYVGATEPGFVFVQISDFDEES